AFKMLQEWYPDPPLVLFVSNNEHKKLSWIDVEQDVRYLRTYGSGRDDDFKRKVVAEAWITRYRALQEGMREGLESPVWQERVIFVAYDNFGPSEHGRIENWKQYSLYTPGR